MQHAMQQQQSASPESVAVSKTGASMSLQQPGASALLSLQHTLSVGSCEAEWGLGDIELRLELLHQELLKVSATLSRAGQTSSEGTEEARTMIHGHLISLLRKSWAAGLPLIQYANVGLAEGSAEMRLMHAVLSSKACRSLWPLVATGSNGGGGFQSRPEKAFWDWVRNISRYLSAALSLRDMSGSPHTLTPHLACGFADSRNKAFHTLALLAARLWVFVRAAHPLMSICVTVGADEAAVIPGRHRIVKNVPQRAKIIGCGDIIAACVRPGVSHLPVVPGAEPPKVAIEEHVAVAAAAAEGPEEDWDWEFPSC